MFKEGEQLVAIKDDHYLTKDKVYIAEQVQKTFDDEYLVFLEVDDGIAQWYGTEDFISLLEYRKQKISKIKERICLK